MALLTNERELGLGAIHLKPCVAMVDGQRTVGVKAAGEQDVG